MSRYRWALLDVPSIGDPSILVDLLVADIFATYEATMVDLIDRFLPSRRGRVRRRALTPWFDAEYGPYGAGPVDSRGCTDAPGCLPTAWVKFVRDIQRRYREKERTRWESKIAAHAAMGYFQCPSCPSTSRSSFRCPTFYG